MGPIPSPPTFHAGDTQPARFYAVNGDIDGLDFGDITSENLYLPNGNPNGGVVEYQAAKAVDIRAGGDIVDFGEPL